MQFSENKKLVEPLAIGADGIIYRHENNQYIIKKMKYNPNKDILPSIINEINILNNMDHNNIIKMININFNTYKGEIDIIMPDKGVTLLSFLLENELNEDQVDQIIMQLLITIDHLHLNNYVHGDLSLNNILVQENDNKLNITLIDFSTTTKNQRYYRSKYYPTAYVCPIEFLNDGKILDCTNPKSTDIFSLGCILYFIITKVPLFTGIDKVSQYNNICDELINKKNKKFDLIKGHYLCKIIKKMIQMNPNKRPSIRNILENSAIVYRLNKYNILQTKLIANERNKKKYYIDINLKIELVKTMLKFCVLRGLSYESIFLTIENMTTLPYPNYYEGIIMFWLSINIIDNIEISIDEIIILIKKKIPRIEKDILLLKKIEVLQKFKYKINNSTIYQHTYNLNVNSRKNIIRDAIILISFTDKTNISLIEIRDLIYINMNKKNKGEYLEKKYNQVKKILKINQIDLLNQLNQIHYRKYNIKYLRELMEVIEKSFV